MEDNLNINSRIKFLRKKLKLTQIDFANRIGITQGTLSGIEKGNVSVSNQNIKSICKEFEVNESWLKDGSGNMKLELSPDDYFAKIVARALKDEKFKNMFIEIGKWSDDEINIMIKAAKIIKRSNL